MYRRVHEELLVKQNHHTLNCAEDFGLDARWPVGLAQAHERAEDVFGQP